MATLGLIDKIKSVLTTPDKFFASVKKEEGYGEPVKYYAVTTLVNAIASIALINFAAGMMPSVPYQMFAGSLGAAAYVILWVLGIVFSFVSVAVMHIFVYLFGGRNGYQQSYKAAAYGGTAANLFSWVPYAGILESLYSLYLTVKGISVLQNMSTARAAAVILVPVFIAVVIAFVIAGAAVLALLGAQAAA